MNKKLLYFFIIVILIIISFSCTNESGLKKTVKTVSWEDDGNGYIQFSTNDVTKCGIENYFHSSSDDQDPFTSATFYLIHKSGYESAEYGAIFCYNDIDNYYKILIINSGKYFVSEEYNGSSTNVDTGWISTSNLKTGYDKINKINITRDSNGKFTIYINDANTYSFTNTDLTGGSNGFYSRTDSKENENFPDIPDDTRFKITIP
ncbi:MAG: hypothetical protein GXO85_08370 [Chlorobi bacterium]|nr:hypothetical protein [Chlorobiota bacterium]